MSVGWKSSCFVTVVAILGAFLYKRNADEMLKDRLNNVLSGLLRAERKVGLARPKVAVGFGACEDVFVNATEFLSKLGIIPSNKVDHFNSVADRSQLEEMFSYFFKYGAAAERFVESEELFRDMVKLARSLKNVRTAVGGNAPVMANRFAIEGCDVLLGAKVSGSLFSNLNKHIKVAGGSLPEDDIHLLMEYQTGDTWGSFKSPRANRFIVHSDNTNPTISSLEAFAEELKSFTPSLLAVGGLQMMDNFPFKEGEREKRLGKLGDLMAAVPQTTRIHFEMASFTDEDLLRDLAKYVIPYSDSLGMNEQELPNLASLLTNGSVILISDAYPRVATILDHMRAVYNILKETPASQGRRPLTRLHVHTLAFQAILTTKGSAWKNTMSAAAKASLTANRHVCGSDWIHVDKAKMIMDESFSSTLQGEGKRIPVQDNRPVTCWEEQDFDICIAPVLVCTNVKQTTGGGDNISSAGLVLQI